MAAAGRGADLEVADLVAADVMGADLLLRTAWVRSCCCGRMGAELLLWTAWVQSCCGGGAGMRVELGGAACACVREEPSGGVRERCVRAGRVRARVFGAAGVGQ